MSIASDLEKVLSDIRDKTGVEVSLTPNGGVKRTLNDRGEEVSFWLEGEGEQVEKTAELICYLIQSVDIKQLFPQKEDYLRNILLGEGGSWYLSRFMTKFNLPTTPCYAIELSCPRMLSEVLAQIENCLSDPADMAVKMDEHKIAVVKFCEENLSPIEFGRFLCQSLYEELGVRVSVGVGCEGKHFSEIAQSYHQAAIALRMSELFRSKGEAHTYREYLLVKMLEDIPEGKLKEYMAQFNVSGTEAIFSDEEMIETAEEFLENSLNISETSRNLYMHRNTLMYRLDKIERVTGLNLRKFSDAVTFRILTICNKLLKR